MLTHPILRSLHLFSFTHTATTEIYTLSLHDALPILGYYSTFDMISSDIDNAVEVLNSILENTGGAPFFEPDGRDRKSTRLNSSHVEISYAVFCLKKKKIVKQ